MQAFSGHHDDVPANAPDVALSRMGTVAIDRRRRLRVSAESARDAVAIDVSAADQTLANASRGVYISVGGTLVCRLKDATADSTFAGLLPGQVYPFAVSIIRKTNTTITGVALL